MEAKPRTLLIDDERALTCDHAARSFNEGLAALRDQGPWDTLLLDHDLASFDENKREWTGYDILKWLAENLDKRPRKVVLVTSNPVGRRRMMCILSVNLGYDIISPVEFELAKS